MASTYPGIRPGQSSVTTASLVDGAVTNAKLNNSGSTAGRLDVPVLIAKGTFSAAADLSALFPAFTAGVFRSLEFTVRSDSGAATSCTVALTGLTAGTAYVSSSIYNLGGIPAGQSDVASASWLFDFTEPARLKLEVDILTGGFRFGSADVWIDNGGTTVHYKKHVHNTDTTNNVTRVAVVFAGGTATGYAELWGRYA